MNRQYIKIFAVCAHGDNSGVAASKDLEERVNIHLRRSTGVRLVSILPIMNSDVAWTEMSVTCVFEGQEQPE